MKPLPDRLRGRLFNPQRINSPCDALTGPCACSAWHHEDELIGRILGSQESGLFYSCVTQQEIQ